jgi:hypothetical protein
MAHHVDFTIRPRSAVAIAQHFAWLIAWLRAWLLAWLQDGREDRPILSGTGTNLLDALSGYARVGRMGAGWLARLRDHRVIAVDPEAVRVVARTAARLSIYRPETGAVPAWHLHPP